MGGRVKTFKLNIIHQGSPTLRYARVLTFGDTSEQ